MESTCKENCPFIKNKLYSSGRECPNYIESWWQEGDSGQPKLISDCAPKRILIQQQIEVNRMFALQQAIEQMRNRLEALEGVLNQLIHQSKEYLRQQPEKQLLTTKRGKNGSQLISKS